jgi:hypothetical protein
MPDYVCHSCNQRKSQSSGIFECTKCGKVLCQSCKGYTGSYCKDSPKAKVGCSSSFKKK